MRWLDGIATLLGRKIHADVKYFFKGSVWLALGQTTTMLLAFLSAYVFARYLPKDIFGQYQFLSSLITILPIFSLSGLSTSLIRSVAKGSYSSLHEAVKSQFRWSLPGSLVALALAIYYLSTSSYSFSLIIITLAFTFPVFNAFSLYEAFLSGKMAIGLLSSLNIIQTILLNSVLVIGALLFTDKFLYILIPYLILQAFLSVLSYWYICPQTKSAEQQKDPALISFAKHLSIIGILSTVADQIDNLVLYVFLGPSSLAIYVYATAIPEQIKNAYKNIAFLALPRYSNHPIGQIRYSLNRHIIILGLAAIIVSVIYILAAEPIFRLLFPKYLASVPFSRVFALSFITFPMFNFLPILQSQELTSKIYRYQALFSTVQILLVVFGAYYYGIFGVIIARVIARCVNFLYGYLLISRD